MKDNYICPKCKGHPKIFANKNEDGDKYIDEEYIKQYKLYTQCEHCSCTGFVDWVSYVTGSPIDPYFDSGRGLREINILITWLKLFQTCFFTEDENQDELWKSIGFMVESDDDNYLYIDLDDVLEDNRDLFNITCNDLIENGVIPYFNESSLSNYINGSIKRRAANDFLNFFESLFYDEEYIKLEQLHDYLKHLGVNLKYLELKSIEDFLEDYIHWEYFTDNKDTIKSIKELEEKGIIFTDKYFKNHGMLKLEVKGELE